jgi:PPM family protein phosphatase
MTVQDWAIVLALFVVALAAAYVMGSRSRAADTARATREDEEGAASEAAAGNASSAEESTDAPRSEGARADSSGDSAPMSSPPTSSPPTSAPMSSPPMSGPVPKHIMPNLAMLEDYAEDDDVEPTKIGVRPPRRAIYQPPVQRIVYDEDAAFDEPTHAELLFLVSATAQTDTGLRRKRNEDSVLVLESAGLFVVADGMGGYRGGELASQLAVTTIGDAFRRHAFEGEPHENIPVQASELARSIQMANAAILETAKQRPELEGMGTTLCAARFSPNKKRVFLGHVGDSRCYRLRDGVLTQMTADHTMADHGVQGPESAHLSRAVGIWPTVPIDIIMAVPLPHDVYLLCSDGLTKMLNDEIIANVLRAEEDLKAAVERLILFANSRGGKDNITVVLVRVVPPDWRPKPSEPFAEAT